MAIPIKKIKEHCCDEKLKKFNIIEMDKEDDIGSTCDKVIECKEKYFLIEEKSLTLAFLDNCCKELSKSLEDYKNKEYLNISALVTSIQILNIDIKKRILAETLFSLTNTSAKKASNTTDILNKKYNSTKTSDMPIFYLYCSSGHPIDRIINTLMSRYTKGNYFIECDKLEEKLLATC